MRRSCVVFAGAWVLVWSVGLSLSPAQTDQAKPKKAAPLPNCPVMGEPIDFSVSTATDDGPVFFCCSGCIEKYTKNGAKYAEKVAAQRVALKDRPKIQVTCPVSGKPVDAKVSIDQDGQKVSFCCKGCVGKYEADPGKFKTALANGYTYQTKCPVTGEEIDPAASSVLASSQKIYYCCPKCGDKLTADPAKYAPKLAAQGVFIDVKKMLEAGKKEASGHEAHDHGG